MRPYAVGAKAGIDEPAHPLTTVVESLLITFPEPARPNRRLHPGPATSFASAPQPARSQLSVAGAVEKTQKPWKMVSSRRDRGPADMDALVGRSC